MGANETNNKAATTGNQKRKSFGCGSPLKDYLEENGISQADLWRMLKKRNEKLKKEYGEDCDLIAGATLSRLNLIANGIKQNINIWLYIAIADVLGISLDYLLGRTEKSDFYTKKPFYDGANKLNQLKLRETGEK